MSFRLQRFPHIFSRLPPPSKIIINHINLPPHHTKFSFLSLDTQRKVRPDESTQFLNPAQAIPFLPSYTYQFTHLRLQIPITPARLIPITGFSQPTTLPPPGYHKCVCMCESGQKTSIWCWGSESGGGEGWSQRQMGMAWDGMGCIGRSAGLFVSLGGEGDLWSITSHILFTMHHGVSDHNVLSCIRYLPLFTFPTPLPPSLSPPRVQN